VLSDYFSDVVQECFGFYCFFVFCEYFNGEVCVPEPTHPVMIGLHVDKVEGQEDLFPCIGGDDVFEEV